VVKIGQRRRPAERTGKSAPISIWRIAINFVANLSKGKEDKEGKEEGGFVG
jgi:hypothetical protein